MFQITIKEIKEVASVKQEWLPLHRECDRTEYGYGPEIKSTSTIDTELLRQTVADLNIISVIRAINNIDSPEPSDALSTRSRIDELLRCEARYKWLEKSVGAGLYIGHCEGGISPGFFVFDATGKKVQERYATFGDAVDAAAALSRATGA